MVHFLVYFNNEAEVAAAWRRIASLNLDEKVLVYDEVAQKILDIMPQDTYQPFYVKSELQVRLAVLKMKLGLV